MPVLSTIETMCNDFAAGFDVIRFELLGEDAVLVLLKEDGTTKAFDELQEISSGWSFEYSNRHSTTTFNVADMSGPTSSNVNKATHLIVRGSVMASLNGTLHELKSDSAPPSPDSPWWKIRAEATSRKYIAPEEI